MDPILGIIKYLFQRKNIKNEDKSIDSFFENGISFPLFVSSVLNIDKIPKIISSPKTDSQKQKNNDIALQYLYKNNKIIGELHPKIMNLNDKQKLLLLIIKKQCFSINNQEIVYKCNLIVNKLGIRFINVSELISLTSLLSLLNVLTDGKVQINKESNSTIDEIMTKSFSDANVPLVINKGILDSQNLDFILIQIEIIFDVFKDKLKQIDNFQYNYYSEQYLDDDGEILKLIEMRKRQELKKLLRSKITNDQENEEELLMTLNAIGGGKFHFNTFYDTILNDSLPKFVIFFFQISSIENVDLNNKKKVAQIHKINKKQIKNIEAVIEFIKSKEIGFKFLIFNFRDIDTQLSSAKLFYTNFLNYFFIKGSKQMMYNRCAILLCTKEELASPDYYQLEDFRTYIALLHIIIYKNFNFTYKKLSNDEQSAKQYFNDANIPMIISNKILKKNCGFSDTIFYQLQFIFNAIDQSPSLSIVEYFLRTIYTLEKIRVPNSNVIKNFKNYSTKVRKSRLNQYLNRKVSSDENVKKPEPKEIDYTIHESVNIKEIKILERSNEDSIPQDFGFDENNKIVIFERSDEDSIPQDFGFDDDDKDKIIDKKAESKVSKPNSIQQDIRSNDKDSKQENSISNDFDCPVKNQSYFKSFKERADAFISTFLLQESTKKHLKLPKKFWTPYELNITYDSGILHWMPQNDQIRNDWAKEINDANENVKAKTSTIETSKETNKIELKIYKLIYYEETENKWHFNNDIYLQLLSHRNFNSGKRTSVIFLFNSYEKDSISFISKLFNCQSLQLDDDQIFVYSISEAYLFEKVADPIFLLLHVPKNKEKLPNLFEILFQIYIFLSYISNLRIIILNKNYYQNQIETTRIIDNIMHMLPHNKLGDFESMNDDDEEKELNDDEITSSDDFDLSEEEEKWENKNIFEYEIDQNLINNTSKILNADAEIIFLMNDSSLKSSKKIDNDDELCSKIKSKLASKSQIHCINIKELKTYEHFLDNLTDVFQKNKSAIYNITTNLQCIDLTQSFHFSNIYFHFKTSPNSNDELKEKIIERYSSANPTSTNFFFIINELRKELITFLTRYDSELISFCDSVLIELRKKDILNIRSFLEKELKQSALDHLQYIRKEINKKKYWEPEQQNNIIWSHKLFLKNEFLSIIQYSFPDTICDEIYEECIDILQERISIGFEEINLIFRPQVIKLYQKYNGEYKNFEGEANYKMKETEHTKEVKIMIEAGDNLKDFIPQDF